MVLETLAATLPNIADERTRVFVYVDDDDEATKLALSTAKFPAFKGKVFGVVRPRPLTIAEKWNWMAEEKADAYLVMVDHSSHRTPGFDKVILEAAGRFDGAPGAILGPKANMSFHCANACTRAWVDAVGYIYPPYFPYWFTDHWCEDVVRMSGLHEVGGLVVDSSKKPTTQELREPGWWATFFDAARSLREDDVRKVVGLPENKPISVALQRRIDLRNVDSRLINDCVRGNAPGLTKGSKLSLVEERYLRVKDKAKEMLPGLLARLPEAERTAYSKVLYPPTHIANIPKAYAAEMRK